MSVRRVRGTPRNTGRRWQVMAMKSSTVMGRLLSKSRLCGT